MEILHDRKVHMRGEPITHKSELSHPRAENMECIKGCTCPTVNGHHFPDMHS